MAAPEGDLGGISSRLDLFLLSSLDNPFTQKGGALDKLCFYCEILLQGSKVSDETILVLLEEMRNGVMKIRSKLIFWKKKAPLREEIETEFTELYKQLHRNLASFFPPSILSSKNPEPTRTSSSISSNTAKSSIFTLAKMRSKIS